MKDVTQSMNWLHSWSGLLFGWVLFAIFLTGTLSVFNTEITYWLQLGPPEVVSDTERLEGTVPHVAESVSDSEERGGFASGDRTPVVRVKFQDKRTFSGQTIDPSTGKMVTFRDTQGGDFFYHFHYGLQFGLAGAWIVGSAGMAMLLALVTGLGIQRGSIKDLVTSRLRTFSQRAWLDAHNLISLLVLPFHVTITITGLIILWSIVMPAEFQFLSGGGFAHSVLSALHFVQFGGATVRWLYFIMGLASCAMIATGLVLWTAKRRKYYPDGSNASGYRFVESLNVAAVAGLLVASAAFCWANRLLPMALIDRSLWEVRCFFLVWCLCVVHGLLRGGSIAAWKEQLYSAAVLVGLLPVLNGLTTNSHLLITGPRGQWTVAGVDLAALTIGVLLGWVARRVGQGNLEKVTPVLYP